MLMSSYLGFVHIHKIHRLLLNNFSIFQAAISAVYLPHCLAFWIFGWAAEGQPYKYESLSLSEWECE